MGNTLRDLGPGVRLVAGARSWIEGESLRQLEVASRLEGMRRVVGMPDLHPGKGGPVGAAFLSTGMIHPSLVGSDIGCGMGLWSTDLPARKAKPDRLAERLNGLDRPWGGDTASWLEGYGLVPTPHDETLGSPGRGNHFIEALRISQVVDEVGLQSLGLDATRLAILVHSGSRGLGEAVLREVTASHGSSPLAEGSPEGQAYLAAHGRAVRWAEANRALCARRTCEAIGVDATRCLDICHNGVEAYAEGGCSCWLHRKGAAPADRGPVVIPGSRGDLSFLVQPLPGEAADLSLRSLAHGAGRKLARHEVKGKLKSVLRREDLTRTRFGGRVVCGDENLLWEEAPGAYKPIERVIGDLEEAGLCRVIAVMEPLVTFKTSMGAQGRDREDGQDWRRERARRAREDRRGYGEGRR